MYLPTKGFKLMQPEEWDFKVTQLRKNYSLMSQFQSNTIGFDQILVELDFMHIR